MEHEQEQEQQMANSKTAGSWLLPVGTLAAQKWKRQRCKSEGRNSRQSTDRQQTSAPFFLMKPAKNTVPDTMSARVFVPKSAYMLLCVGLLTRRETESVKKSSW